MIPVSVPMRKRSFGDDFANWIIPSVERMCVFSFPNAMHWLAQPHSGWTRNSASGASACQRVMSCGRIPACTWHSPIQMRSLRPVTFSSQSAEEHVGQEQDLRVLRDRLDDALARSRTCSSSRSPPSPRPSCSRTRRRRRRGARPSTRAAGRPVIEAASEQPASRSGISTVFCGLRIAAVSAMKCTPQKTIVAGVRRRPPRERARASRRRSRRRPAPRAPGSCGRGSPRPARRRARGSPPAGRIVDLEQRASCRAPGRRRVNGAEWVSAPTEISSTPVSAMARMVSSVTPPEASRRARPAVSATASRSSFEASCCRAGSRRRRRRAPRATWSSVSHSTSIGSVGRGAHELAPRPATEPAARRWLSLTRTASSRPKRWLRPPPQATAYFSSARRPGVVLRVSRMAAPVPSIAST